MAVSRLLLCGPQYTNIDHSLLLEFRDAVTYQAPLQFLLRALRQLPTLRHCISEACPETVYTPSAHHWDIISQFLCDGSLKDPVWRSPSNALLAPLTVAFQFFHISNLQGDVDGHANLFAVLSSIDDVQGCCIGSLTAAVVQVSQDERQLELLATRAVNIAACI